MQATANLQHPNIVTVYTYGLHAGTNRPFLVMEYVEGRTLAEEARAFHAGWGTLTEEADSLYARRIARPNPEFTRLLNGFAQACDAIHYAHTQRIVHRDPKPANILLREDGMAKLIDFGLVKLLGGRDESSDSAGLDDRGPFDASLTLTGAVLGTPAFMSPEQARNPANVTTSSDIYVLGAGLFFILTGRPPLVGNTMVEVLSQLVDGRIPRPRAVLPHVPVELDDLCARAMAFRPEDRYPSAAALAADIRNWLARGSADSRPPSPVSEPSIPTGTSSHMPPVLRSPAERPTWRASDTPEVRSSRNVSWLPLVSVALTFLVIGVAIAYWLVPMLARLWQ